MNAILAVPVYNEVSTISAFFDTLTAHLPEEIREIYIINDGSTDRSGEEIRDFAKKEARVALLERKHNEGYGASMIAALRHAGERGCDYLITIDCDLQHRPEDLKRFIEFDPRIDIVSGSRYLPESQNCGSAPPERVEINERITAMLNRRYGWNLSDTFCGFKRYRLARIDPGFFTVKGYAFPLEFWAYAHHHRLSIQEIGVSRIYVTDDRSFGEDLDKKNKRFRYYIKTWRETERRLQAP
jgi:dolichol-phosphate mannosyltransferase